MSTTNSQYWLVSPSWACWLTSNINDTLTALSGRPHAPERSPSPPTGHFHEVLPANPAPLRRSRSRKGNRRPADFYLPSAPVLHLPNPGEVGQNGSNPPILPRRNSMPAGEHSIAARSRLRYEKERRKSRSSQNDSSSRSSSMRSRRDSTPTQRQSCSSAVVMKSSVDGSSGPKACSRLSLPIIPASPAGAGSEKDKAISRYARDLCLDSDANVMFGSVAPRRCRRGRSHTRRQTQLWDNLASLPAPSPAPAQIFMPSVLTPGPKGHTTTFEKLNNAHRLSGDVSRLPLSAKLQAWHVWFYGTSPAVQCRTVLEPRPASNWSVNTEEHLSRTSTSHGSHSLGKEWHMGNYGRRKFEDGSGFWK